MGRYLVHGNFSVGRFRYLIRHARGEFMRSKCGVESAIEASEVKGEG